MPFLVRWTLINRSMLLFRCSRRVCSLDAEYAWMCDCRILIAVCFMIEFFRIELVSIGFDSCQVRALTFLQLAAGNQVHIHLLRCTLLTN